MALSVLHPRVLPADVSLAQLWELDNLVRQRVRGEQKTSQVEKPSAHWGCIG